MLTAFFQTLNTECLPKFNGEETLTTSLTPEIESIVAPWIAKKEHINLAIGVIRGSERWVKGWGSLPSESNPSESNVPESNTPDGDTIFEIGSVTKVFTATLLSLLVERGKIELTAPLSQFGDNYQKFPDTVTLESLATHTSGLPRLPENGDRAARENPQNPYANYTFENLNEYLQNYDGKPGKTAGSISYSNLGVGILGNVLAQQCDRSYEDAIIEQICRPLGLKDTSITLTQSQQARLALGYFEDGKLTPHWDLPTFAGAGALRSTVNDLLTFLEANLQPGQTPMAEAILNTHKLRHQTFAPTGGLLGLLGGVAKWIRRLQGSPLVEREETGVGLGWFVDYLPSIDRDVRNHNGGTGGHRSFCGFIEETQTGVVVLSNYGEVLSSMFGRYSIDAVGLKILETINLQDFDLS